MRSASRFAALAIFVLLLSGVSLAVQNGAMGKDDKSGCRREQDCALDALKSGEIKPLSDVLAVVRDKLPGEVIKVELDREDGVWVYELKVLTPSGKRRKIEIDARTLSVKEID